MLETTKVTLKTAGFQRSDTPKTRRVQVGPITIGGPEFVVAAGPCSIESEDQFASSAHHVVKNGGVMLRGGIYKMRTSPRSFQGLGLKAAEIARKARAFLKVPVISEVSDPRQIEELYDCVDMFQVGTRNMFNYSLLQELGKCKKPVLLKRGFSALIDEWLYAAEYIIRGGNEDIVLCERGIRTFETATRNTLDLSAVAYIKEKTHFPVFADPSHGTGVRELITPMARAAVAAGADGLLLELHPNPAEALSDGQQALTFADFSHLMSDVTKILQAMDRPLHKL